MAWHRGLRRMRDRRLAHAVHRFELTSTSHRRRPQSRDEHDEHQKSCKPARYSPHLRNSISVAGTHLPALSKPRPRRTEKPKVRLRTGNREPVSGTISVVHKLAGRLLKTIR